MEYISVKKIGKVINPKNPLSDFGDSKDEHIGLFVKLPEEGEIFIAQGVNYHEQGIITTPVTKIINNNTFETLNSIYQWDFIKDKTYGI